MPSDTAFFHRAVWLLRDAGLSQKQASDLLASDVSSSSVNRWWNESSRDWHHPEVVVPKKSPGRPRELTPAQEKNLGSLLKCKGSLRQVANKMELSESGVHRVARRQGLVFKKTRRVPMLTEKAQGDRVKYAREHLRKPDSFWKSILWTDESAFYLNRTKADQYWDHETNPRRIQPSPHNTGKVMVWGGISAKGATPLVILEWQGTGLTAVDYQKQVLGVVKKFCDQEGASSMLFMQDNAPVHSAASTTRSMTARKIKTFPEGGMKWPANSPDLNPIENVWAWMKQELCRLDSYPTIRETMVHELKIIWKRLTPEFCQRYTNGNQKRLKKVVEAKGATLKY